MKVSGKVAHLIVAKATRLQAVRSLLRQLAEEEARLVEELDSILNASVGDKIVKSITATEIEVEADGGE